MGYIESYYPESRFGGFTNIDGTMAFYNRVEAFVSSDSILLDIGCGEGEYLKREIPIRKKARNFKGRVKKVIGIDVSEKSAINPTLDEFRIIKGDAWPVDTGSVDICISDNVLEHVADPELFFSECVRVLKPGGYVFLKTPNLFSYFGLFSKFIPSFMHSRIIGRLQNTRLETEVFPAFYRCNTTWKLRKMFKKHGFNAVVVGYEPEPAYLSFSRFAYLLGVFHQKFAPGFLKVGLFAFGKKI